MVNSRIHALVAVLVFTSLLIGIWYVDRNELHRVETNDRIQLNDFIQRSAARLSSAVAIRLQLTQLLSAIVSTDPDFATENFDTISSALIGDMKGIISLQLAPGGIVTYVTDLERNRAAIGHDLLVDPKRRELTMQAINERRYIIAGPLKLKQGGEAIIARLPIFTKDEDGLSDSFWGLATVLVDVPALFEEAALSTPDKTIEIALRGKDGKGDVPPNMSSFISRICSGCAVLPNVPSGQIRVFRL